MMSASYPVPTEDLLAEWEAEVAHTTIDEIGHVAKRAAEWGWRQCAMEGLLREASTARAQPEPEVAGLEAAMQHPGVADVAALSRYGRPAPAPAGELRKEAAWLRNECSAENAEGNWISMSIDQALDLAELLERQAVTEKSSATAPAAAGELAEVAAWLRAYCSEEFGPHSVDPDVSWLTRAADLLEHQAAPVPVADDYEVASAKTMRRIRSTTKRWKVTVTITTNDSAIDTRLGAGIWKVLDTENEILESVSLPQLLTSNSELPLPSGEVGS